ncbi:MAG: electron transfer flavoprotein subunit alpha/FixB family protein [Bifidobacteriaceae bacterium]|jgi:electron transfer flavoprotein alpha subunit|nr:electron transfer flavoprotein subunit alpha/FixB family protein [Bifidobacteriaceae bacterium]
MSDILTLLDDPSAEAERLAAAGRLGTPVGVRLNGGLEAHAQPGRVAEGLAALAEARAAAAVLLPAGLFGAEVGSLLAWRLDSGVITDVIQLDPDLTATKPVMAGTSLTRARVAGGVAIFTVRATAGGAGDGDADAAATAATAAAAEVVELPAAAPRPGEDRIQVTSVTGRTASGARPDLADANIIVSAGRGTGGDLTAVEELADALGAAVAASRAAVDAGWVDSSLQVGQTGKTVSPRLYVAAGISGAIQHQAGMRGAELIVAVNEDPDAPIFEIADLGIVGDLGEVLPAAAAAVRSRA